MTTTLIGPTTADERDHGAALKLIDCDAHHNSTSIDDVLPYLSANWADYVRERRFRSVPNAPDPKGVGGGERVDARPAAGRRAPTAASSAASSSTSGASTSRS